MKSVRSISSNPAVASTAVAAVLAAVYLAWAPPSQDLAAATFRADLFSEHGFAFWNDVWYSGHYLFAYSVLYPALGALLGVRVTAALAVVAAAALFAALAERRFPDRALLPSLWFAVGVSSWLLTGRVPFLVGVPLGLGALLALDRGWLAVAGLLAAASSLASPVAGLFVALAGVALALAGQVRKGIWLALPAAGVIGVLSLAFPTAGEEPFVFSAFIAIPLLAVAVVVLVPPEHRAVRIGALLYTLLALGIVVIADPLGGNVTRLGALFAGPVLALLVWPRGALAVAAVSLPLLYWQLIAPVRDVGRGTGDLATEREFYEPLLTALDRAHELGNDPQPPYAVRVHIPPTQNRWEAAYVAPRYPIARGWLRQLESGDFDLFTDGNLTAGPYRAWLREHGVSYVAVPDADLDYLAEDEVELVASGLPYLDEVWKGDDWALYRVVATSGLTSGPISLERLDATSFQVSAFRPAEGVVRIHWTPYWEPSGASACVSRSGNWTRIELREAGEVTVEAVPDLDGLLRQERECSG
ncbi:MAG: hypothetical protein ACRDK9_05390 [Solirubrobacterales bacterium]